MPRIQLGRGPEAAARVVAYLIVLKAFSRATCASVPRKVAIEKKSRPTQSSCALAIRVSMSQSIPIPEQARPHVCQRDFIKHCMRCMHLVGCTVHLHCLKACRSLCPHRQTRTHTFQPW